MEYWALGGRPLLSRFPHHVPGIFAASRRASGSLVQAGALVADPTIHACARTPCSRADAGPEQEKTRCEDQQEFELPKAPIPLHSGFDPTGVLRWEPERWENMRKLQDATRNRGQVDLMREVKTNRLVAVKRMPTGWVCCSHEEFVREHPVETELPWQDVGCVQFLNDVEFEYACTLHGVYRDSLHTFIVMELASEGDLFGWCERSLAPGPQQEELVLPIARQLAQGVRQLHEYSIVHRDLSLENVLLARKEDGSLGVRIIDFGMASTTRHFRDTVRGKASYQAPEVHTGQPCDAFLTDAFAVGVTLYALLVKDYPWLSTRTGGCKCFEYVQKNGLRSYMTRRKLRGSSVRVSEVVSEPLKDLLEGLLQFDPAKRLTLGEEAWTGSGGRRSVWDMAWLHAGPDANVRSSVKELRSSSKSLAEDAKLRSSSKGLADGA